MAAPGADDGALWGALEQVNLADFLRSMDGLDTPLTEGGGNLSGGQRQRLALARALLHDSPVYIFDEATSNIDVESENDIMAGIHRLAGRKTVILISHRLANVTKGGQYLRAGSRPSGLGAGDARGTAGAGRAVRRPVEPASRHWKTTERRHSDGKQTYSRQFQHHVPPCWPGTPSRPGHGLRRSAGRSGLFSAPSSSRFWVCMRCWTACTFQCPLFSKPPVFCCRFWPWPAAYSARGAGLQPFYCVQAAWRSSGTRSFGVLRQLAPQAGGAATKGDLIAVLTADIGELLEGFYAPRSRPSTLPSS